VVSIHGRGCENSICRFRVRTSCRFRTRKKAVARCCRRGARTVAGRPGRARVSPSLSRLSREASGSRDSSGNRSGGGDRVHRTWCNWSQASQTQPRCGAAWRWVDDKGQGRRCRPLGPPWSGWRLRKTRGAGARLRGRSGGGLLPWRIGGPQSRRPRGMVKAVYLVRVRDGRKWGFPCSLLGNRWSGDGLWPAPPPEAVQFWRIASPPIPGQHARHHDDRVGVVPQGRYRRAAGLGCGKEGLDAATAGLAVSLWAGPGHPHAARLPGSTTAHRRPQAPLAKRELIGRIVPSLTHGPKQYLCRYMILSCLGGSPTVAIIIRTTLIAAAQHEVDAARAAQLEDRWRIASAAITHRSGIEHHVPGRRESSRNVWVSAPQWKVMLKKVVVGGACPLARSLYSHAQAGQARPFASPR